jgi:ubiquitin carboxyl-terminal hydrolase L5
MNIILNIPENTSGIDIGENLRMFRAHSIEMTPPNRGLDLAGFEFVRSAHNRFGKRLETCHEDISMEQKYEQSQKKNKKKAVKDSSSQGASGESDVYHFIAYIPFEGNVYELDGLKRSPSVVGRYPPAIVVSPLLTQLLGVVKENESWANIVIPLLLERFQDHAEDGIETNLLAVCQDKATFLRQQIEGLNELVREFDVSSPVANLDNLPRLFTRFANFPHILNYVNQLAAEPTVENYVQIRQAINKEIEMRSRDIAEEREKMDGYVEYSTRRRHNYMPFITEYLTILARKGFIAVEPKEEQPKGKRGGRK